MVRRFSSALEVCGAASAVAGCYVLFGVGVALLVGGAVAMVFGMALGGRR